MDIKAIGKLVIWEGREDIFPGVTIRISNM